MNVNFSNIEFLSVIKLVYVLSNLLKISGVMKLVIWLVFVPRAMAIYAATNATRLGILQVTVMPKQNRMLSVWIKDDNFLQVTNTGVFYMK